MTKKVNELRQAICRIRTEANNRGHLLRKFLWDGMGLVDPSLMSGSKFKGQLVEAATYRSSCAKCKHAFVFSWAPGFGVLTSDETTNLMARECGKT